MVKNNLYMVEKNLRSIAKRYKGVKYSLGLAILFLMMGLGAFAQDVMSTEEIAASKENLRSSVGTLQNKVEAARKENQKVIDGLRLELIQLMEQGDQVVKSPWASWQFGANYMYNDWRGTYKGRGDKAEKYPYEGVFTRSENPYERYTSPDSKNYSLLEKSSNPQSASTNRRGGLKSYGLAGTKTVKEPIVGFEVSAGINPRVFNAPTVTPLNATQPNLPRAINFVPPTITTPSPNPSAINIVTVNLVQYSNGWGNVLLGVNDNVGDGTHTLSTAPTDKQNAISEYVSESNYSSTTGAIMNIDVTGRRAVTLDPTGGNSGNLVFTNNGVINLISTNTGGIEVQTHENHTKVTGINGSTGTINGKADNQIAMVFTDEDVSPGIYTLQNDGTIIMNGNGSMGYGLKIDTGWVGHALNTKNGTITMNGNNSYGIGIGRNSVSIGPGSSAKNDGTINITGENSGGIAVQKDMSGGIENTGDINISGKNSFGMYSEIAGPLNNDGKINITAGDSNIGLRTGNTATLVNKNEINISSAGKENIGLYASSGTVENDTIGKVTITAGENIGIMSAGTGTANNKGAITVTADGATGAIATGGTVNNEGTISVTGNTSSNGRGAAGIIASGGTFTATGTGTITANVKGKNSVGIYAKNGTATVLQNNIDTADGAVNDGAVNYAVDTNGTINLNGTGTANTGASALLFYNDGGKINVNSPLTANISGGSNTPATRGTAFLYKGTGYSSFKDTDISNWAKNKFGNGTTTTLNNLTLNMAPGSRLFIASDVSMNLSNTTGSTLSSALGATINGSDYKTFMLYNSLLQLDQSINLDNANDAYNQLELSNSSIDNNNSNTITGTQAGQTAIAQENLLSNRALLH